MLNNVTRIDNLVTILALKARDISDYYKNITQIRYKSSSTFYCIITTTRTFHNELLFNFKIWLPNSRIREIRSNKENIFKIMTNHNMQISTHYI